MFGFGWLPHRQIREAIRDGRLEEAQRLLEQPAVQGRRGTGNLVVKLAQAFVARGGRQLQQDEAEGAWNDLLQAEILHTGDRRAASLRQKLTGLGVSEVRALLQAGEVRRADECVARLRQRGVRSPELQVLEVVGKGWLDALEQANHGHFGLALEQLERVTRLFPSCPPLVETREDLVRRREAFDALLKQLHQGTQRGSWGEVVATAEQVLTLAPLHREARKARGQGWQSLAGLPETIHLTGPEPVPQASQPSSHGTGFPERFLLWIDGVGGYLICLGKRVTIGQALTQTHPVDVPLVADISRLHATLVRDSEGYVLEAVHSAKVNGKDVKRALLHSGDRITLGTACQFHFRVPVPVSNSARLDLVSSRLPLSVDAVLLMADTLVLGPGEQSHVEVPDLQTPVVLYRQQDGLGIRHRNKLTCNGQPSPGRMMLGPHATVTGEEVSFAIEPVGAL